MVRFAPQKMHHIVRAKADDGGRQEIVEQAFQIGAGLEKHVGRVFSLIGDPPITSEPGIRDSV
jgi:hypothetical protein